MALLAMRTEAIKLEDTGMALLAMRTDATKLADTGMALLATLAGKVVYYGLSFAT